MNLYAESLARSILNNFRSFRVWYRAYNFINIVVGMLTTAAEMAEIRERVSDVKILLSGTFRVIKRYLRLSVNEYWENVRTNG